MFIWFSPSGMVYIQTTGGLLYPGKGNAKYPNKGYKHSYHVFLLFNLLNNLCI